MSNRTYKNAMRSHGTDPQTLVPHIVRDKIYTCRYWKEECFALNAESIIDKAKSLTCIGFSYGGFNRPCEFLCLLTKLLQISPDFEIIQAYIQYSAGKPTNELEEQSHDLRYLRALAIAYIRLVYRPELVYSLLEPLLEDYRKVYAIDPTGKFELIPMDEWVAKLLDHRNDAVYGFMFPLLTKRTNITNRDVLGTYKSAIDRDLSDEINS